MKKCARCEVEKDGIQFYKESRKKDGLCSICIECEKKRCKERKEKDIEGYRKLKRENARKHAEKTNLKNRKKYEKEKEYILSKSREHYWKNRDKIMKRRKELGKSEETKKKDSERQRIWQIENREKTRIAALKYSKSHREKVLNWHKQWKENNRIKARAQKTLKDHIRRGGLIRPNTCEICKKECKPDGHHTDYTKPLEVMWLCKICHAHQHGKLLDLKP